MNVTYQATYSSTCNAFRYHSKTVRTVKPSRISSTGPKGPMTSHLVWRLYAKLFLSSEKTLLPYPFLRPHRQSWSYFQPDDVHCWPRPISSPVPKHATVKQSWVASIHRPLEFRRSIRVGSRPKLCRPLYGRI